MSIIDPQSPLYQKALAIAVAHFLSHTPDDMTPTQVLDALVNEPESWPADIIPWYPFQYDLPDTVAEHIEALAESIYLAFIPEAYIPHPHAQEAA